MTYDEFRKALFPDGPAEELRIADIARRVGKPDQEDVFDMVGVVDGDVVSMSYTVDEGTVFLAGVKGFVNDQHVLFNVKVTLEDSRR